MSGTTGVSIALFSAAMEVLTKKYGERAATHDLNKVIVALGMAEEAYQRLPLVAEPEQEGEA